VSRAKSTVLVFYVDDCGRNNQATMIKAFNDAASTPATQSAHRQCVKISDAVLRLYAGGYTVPGIKTWAPKGPCTELFAQLHTP